MKYERWHKKDVTLTWNAQRTIYAVAQELFSSHDVDAGSKLLLRSLDVPSLGERGHAVDFGCGYGVLGLAIREALPGWTVNLIDRDALAVAFSHRNGERLGFEDGSVTATVGLSVDGIPESGADLILWNVPGKAGEQVLERLTGDVATVLADGGFAALVIVNPLAGVIRRALANLPEIEIVHDTEHAEHTIIHARKSGIGESVGDAFERGVFDRKLAGFGVDDFDYDITPVIGVPEYDTYSFATQLVFDALRTVEGNVGRALIMRPGQGHVPIVFAHQSGPSRLVLLDRDYLALRASVRAMIDTGASLPEINIVAAPDIIDAADLGPYAVSILLLEDQVRNEIHIARLDDLAEVVEMGGIVIVGGASSVVSRFLSFAAKSRTWKERDRMKRSGASSARLEKVN